MSSSPTHDSQLYRSFKAIEADSYRSIMRFVENHTDELHLLTTYEYFSLQYAYAAALHETGAYDRVVAQTETLLELSIVHDIQTIDGEDVYRTLLIRRAHGMFYLGQHDACLNVCDQALRLYPGDKFVAHLYERALYQRPNRWISRTRALSVLLFLTAAILIAAEVLVIQHFYAQHVAAVMMVRNVAFVAGWLLLLGGDIVHRAWAWGCVFGSRRRYARRRAARREASGPIVPQ